MSDGDRCECAYCGETFESSTAEVSHLETAHEDEKLSPIDQRRVESSGGGLSDMNIFGEIPVGIVYVGATLAVCAVLVFVFTGQGALSVTGKASSEPHSVGSTHYHGEFIMSVEGERVDFRQEKYQVQSEAWHFESGDGLRWHSHSKGVTLDWALESLDMQITSESVRYEGTLYRDADPGTNITFTADGEEVEPSEYVFQPGDTVQVNVTTASTATPTATPV